MLFRFEGVGGEDGQCSLLVLFTFGQLTQEQRVRGADAAWQGETFTRLECWHANRMDRRRLHWADFRMRVSARLCPAPAKLFVNPARSSSCHVVIPCAGTGSRAGGAGPKQYQLIAGKPMVWHTLRAFAHTPRIGNVLVVVAPDDERMQSLLVEYADDWAGAALRTERIGGTSQIGRAHV